MRGEDFEYFISKFGEATKRVAVPASTIDKWCEKLPDQLLKYWQDEGHRKITQIIAFRTQWNRMRDEDFEVFIDEFGEATHRIDVPAEAIQKWRGKLPDLLLTYWQEESWCGYANGLFWFVNPDNYDGIVSEWLEYTPLEQIDTFHVIARTGFGDLSVCGESTGLSVTISCPINAIFALPGNLKPKSKEDQDWSVRGFMGLSASGCDLKDESGVPLFERAVAKLGALEPDEVYGFEPAIAVGGRMCLENLAKLKLDTHLTILRQLASPTLPFSNVDIEKLLNL